MNLLAEIRRRKIPQWLLAYAAGAWVVLQVLGLMADSFEWSRLVMRVSFVLAMLGFAVALVLAWYHGERGLQRVTRGEILWLGLIAVVGGVTLWRMPPAPSAAVATTSVAATEGKSEATSIAVLPFVDMSQARDQEYFSDGLSEELLNLLAQLPQLRVIARTSSFSFKGKEADVATIAKTLNVENVLEGSVRKSGNTLRITAQLIRASDSSHLWSQTYDRELTDVFKVQDEIAAAVVDALKLKLLPAQGMSNLRRSDNPEAYNQFLLGNEFNKRENPDDWRRAVAAYKQAIALDAGFAAAWAALADSEGNLADLAGSRAQMEQALADADHAISLAPELADGYVARGIARLSFRKDWAGAQADLGKALALNPGDTKVQAGYTRMMIALGRVPDAIAAARKASELDPLSSTAWDLVGRLYYASAQYPAAAEALDRALEISPDASRARYHRGVTSLLAGKPAEALAYFQHTGDGYGQAGVAMAEFSRGHARESQQALDQQIAEYAQGSAYQIAEVYAWRGEKDKAFEWLNRAIDQNDGGLTFIKTDPLIASLVKDPRYAALLTRMGLPP